MPRAALPILRHLAARHHHGDDEFLIQNTPKRDAAALHLELDQLLRGVKRARTHLVDLEELSEAELETLHREFQRIHDRASRRAQARKA